MKHKFGFKQTFFALMLAAAGVFGVSNALVDKQMNETPVKEKAEAAATKTFIVYSGSYTNVYAFGGSGEVFGGWPGATMTSRTKGKYAEANDGVPANIIFNGNGQTGDLAYDSSKPFYNDSGKRNLDTSKMLYIYSDDASLNGKAFSYNSDSGVFTYSTSVLNAGTEIKFYCATYRTDWHSGQALSGLSLASEGANYTVDYTGSFTFTCSIEAYGTYDNITYGMTSTFTPAKFSVTYKYYDTNNNSVKPDSSSGTKDAGTSITLPNTPGISVSGYKFYGWYTNYSSGLFSGTHYDGGASYTVNANTTLYAKYVTADKGYVLGTFNDWNEVTGATMTDNSPSSGLRSFVMSFSANDKFYIRYVNSTTDDGVYHYSNLGSGGDAGHNFTTDNDNNFVCSTAGTYMIVLDTGAEGNNVQIYYSPYRDLGYYMAGSGSFGSWSLASAKSMTADPSGNNTAILENGTTGILVTANSELQVWNHSSVSSLAKYSMTLGGDYSFATDVGDNIRITVAGNYNFYFKMDNGTNYLYIVDVGEIENAGTLYLTSPQGTIGNITVSTTNTKSEHQFTNAALNSVSGAQKESTTIKFGDGYIYSIPLFNLRGNDSGSPCTTVTFSWSSPSSGSVTLTGVDSLGGSAQHYYIDRSTSSVSEQKYSAIELIFDIETAINATGANKTVCEVPKATAESLCSRYDTLAASVSELPIATLHTWASSVGDGGADIEIRDLRYELGNRAGGTYKISRAGSFSPISIFGLDEDGNNFTTIIIIVASSVSLLSITALSVLVIKKRKEKQ